MALFNDCYVALGTNYLGRLTELTGGSYSRQALTVPTSYPDGTFAVSLSFGSAAPPPASQFTSRITSAAIFDASTGGNIVASWDWPLPQVAVGSPFPSTLIIVRLGDRLAIQDFATGASILAGQLLGTLNDSPLIAGVDLTFSAGALVAA
jgi:hypothetical protein